MDKKVIYLQQVEDKLNQVSPSMCLAKWTQSTIYLNTGHTHSCHHPSVHPIPLEGLEDNPGMIHNTPHKQTIRQEMLDGKRPPECEYCWRIEDLGNAHNSDRLLKSSFSWSAPHYDRIVQSGTGPDFAPTYLEVLFESTCNFACSYCMPAVSSKWWAESKQHGPYKLTNQWLGMIDDQRTMARGELAKADTNPYIEAFWKALPSWWQTLHTFRITGGEPLLSKHTWTLFDYVDQNANKELILGVNTNLGVPSDKIDQLIQSINRIKPKLKDFQVYTSVEATGPQAEYIRYGMDYQYFMSNVRRVLEETTATLTIMTTINALSYSTFGTFLRAFARLKQEFPKRIVISLNYLRHPFCMDTRYLPTEIKEEWKGELERILDDAEIDYDQRERDNLMRFIDYFMVEPTAEEKMFNQRDLAMFAKQMDERRGLDFPKTFPRLAALLPTI